MNGKVKPDMQCAEFEALLAEAVEGSLKEPVQAAFMAHRAACPQCAPLYAEAERGWHWLRELNKEEVLPAPQVLANILRATSRAALPDTVSEPGWWQRLRDRLRPFSQTGLQPRFALSFAMVFFSVAALFSISGFPARATRYADLRPSVLRHDIYEFQGRVVKYYENIRFVYEIESRMREFKRDTEPPENKPQPEPKKELKNTPEGPYPEKKWNAVGTEYAEVIAELQRIRLTPLPAPAGHGPSAFEILRTRTHISTTGECL